LVFYGQLPAGAGLGQTSRGESVWAAAIIVRGWEARFSAKDVIVFR
jgi:hypothetical protein